MSPERPITLDHANGTVTILRDDQGLCHVHGETLADILYGQGWVHARDRQVQLLLQRLIATGTMSQNLGDSEELVGIDRFTRRMNFAGPAQKEAEQLSPEPRSLLESYCTGINRFLTDNGTVWEYRLLGYHADPWKPEDTLSWGRAFTYLGLAMAQGHMEKLIIQLIQHGASDAMIRELFPYCTDKIDRELIGKIKLEEPPVPATVAWLMKLPSMTSSNNWALAPARTESGGAILCGDPHLEVNRLPGIWYEMFLHLPKRTLRGAGIPGFPGIVIGHNGSVSWSPTYSFMDMIDFRIEECRGGSYRRGNSWKPFTVREEIITTKKKRVITERVYENDHGVLEGDPYTAGHYLVNGWSCYRDGGTSDIEAVLELMTAETVKSAMKSFMKFEVNSYNWVAADTTGNIAYQMSGRTFNRPKGTSGLLATPGWEKRFNPKGYIPANKLPRILNPKNGVIITANNDLNRFGFASPINLAMADYRARRIESLLAAKKKHSIDDMKKIQLDLYSLQAAELMPVIKPHLPDTLPGKALKDWDFVYRNDGIEGALFESIYHELLVSVFGSSGMSPEGVRHLIRDGAIFNEYFGNFDAIFLKRKSSWFKNRSRDELIAEAVTAALKKPVYPYGTTRKLTMSHLLFGGKLPSFFGFDYGPIELPGSRGTVLQGQIYRFAGRATSFAPSYRIISDMKSGKVWTALAGGISDRRFSSLYTRGIAAWLSGDYRELEDK